MELPEQYRLISPEDDKRISEIFSILKEHYKGYQDPWGFDLDVCEKTMRFVIPFYRNYFRVRVFGEENVKDKSYIVTSNHTGQIPLDAMLITIGFLLEVKEARVLRSMVERFVPQLPFFGDFTAQLGAILGDRVNCEYAIDHGESILVFPEGVRGIAKNTPDFYKIRPFSHGFYRIALQKKTPILPVCVVGAEEMFPFVFHAKKLAKMLSIPAFPLTPNLFPLPSPIDIYIGKEITIPENLSFEASDKEVKEHVYHVEHEIKKLLITGLKNRRPFFDSLRKPLSKFILKEFKHRGSP